MFYLWLLFRSGDASTLHKEIDLQKVISSLILSFPQIYEFNNLMLTLVISLTGISQVLPLVVLCFGLIEDGFTCNMLILPVCVSVKWSTYIIDSLVEFVEFFFSFFMIGAIRQNLVI